MLAFQSVGWPSLTSEIPAWMGDIHDLLPRHLCGVIVTLAAIVCGAVIGVERGKRQKPAGMRTMILICLGACIFAQVGLLIARPDSDPARVAAQVVAGVGFLGAGAIMHGRRLLVGVTTAAAIWVVASIGVTLGAGYVVPGVFFTALTFLTLMMEDRLEELLCGRCRWETLCIRFDDDSGRTRWRIQGILDDHQVDDAHVRFATTDSGGGVLHLRCCRRHRQHRGVLAELAAIEAVRAVELNPTG